MPSQQEAIFAHHATEVVKVVNDHVKVLVLVQIVHLARNVKFPLCN